MTEKRASRGGLFLVVGGEDAWRGVTALSPTAGLREVQVERTKASSSSPRRVRLTADTITKRWRIAQNFANLRGLRNLIVCSVRADPIPENAIGMIFAERAVMQTDTSGPDVPDLS
jgi:hypothetical protein